MTSEKVCDQSVDCSNQMDEKACFEKKMNRTQAIILNGVGPAMSGVYSLQQWGKSSFYSRNDKLGFVYKPSSEEGFVIGSGETLVSATAVFRSESHTSDLSEASWRAVGDGSLAGRKHGTPAPQVQLTFIPDDFNKSFLENNTPFKEEKTVEKVGVICLSAKNQEKTFIAFNDTEAGWCDKTWHCQFGGAFNIHFIKVV